MKHAALLVALAIISQSVAAEEFYVSPNGSDTNNGTAAQPLRTITAAARRAQPGDVITVHAGVYRERIDPPRGGTSDDKRITYQAAPGEEVFIRGSELVKGWKKVEHDTWKLTLPNDFFGDFNPYADLVRGDWFNPKGREHHTGAVYLNGHWLTESAKQAELMQPVGTSPRWFATVDKQVTTIWAQLPGVDPNEAGIEINARPAVFYPSKPGVNYITVRGFTMEHAATNWAPPTAEQVGLIGTHWSKGWIIENNTIRYSICTGVTLGKYGDQWDNRAQSAEGYVGTINRALANGWSKENIGSHIVRNNHIYHCEQAGIVGSMGPVFSVITGNTIHDINYRGLFGGAEMAGIKFHGAIDTVISHNRIYRSGNFGIWLDWMTQGTHVHRNLVYDNRREDLFVEVNHGPFVVENNILLSANSLLVNSQGGAYAHNLFAGSVRVIHNERRQTPYQKPHSTEVAALHGNPSGDDRYFNNIFVNGGLPAYDEAKLPVTMRGNVFLNGAKPSKHEQEPLVSPQYNPGLKLLKEARGLTLEVKIDLAWAAHKRPLVVSALLGKAAIPDLPYVQPDGSPYRITRDYLGRARDVENPFPGPFAAEAGGEVPTRIHVWPIQQRDAR